MYVYVVSAFSDEGQAFEVNSAVISASTDPKPPEKLTKPVIIASSNLEEVDVSYLLCIATFLCFYFALKNTLRKFIPREIYCLNLSILA